MSDKTIGEKDESLAFQKMLVRWYIASVPPELPSKESMDTYMGHFVYFAFRAGIERGLELRGCCEEKP